MLHNYFSAIFCINLKRRFDRLIEAMAEFDKLGIQPELIEAVDGQQLNMHNVQIMQSIDGTLVSPGDIGCTLSHLKVMRLAKERKLPNYLIFEDDCEFAPNFKERFVTEIKHLPANWDMLYLGGEDKAGITPISENIVKTEKVFTTHAVAFNQSCYDAVIAELSKENEKVDIAISNLHATLNVYSFTPKLVYQRKSFSDILNIDTNYTHLRK